MLKKGAWWDRECGRTGSGEKVKKVGGRHGQNMVGEGGGCSEDGSVQRPASAFALPAAAAA
jgi:hypothetical protein